MHSVVGAGSAEVAEVAAPRRSGRSDRRLNVLIVDDHPVFAQALALAIDASDELRCAGVASTAAEAPALA
jgi:hypothetical protein